MLFPIGDLENLIMIYLLAVVLAALYLGRGPSILATFVGLAAFVYFFVPHYNSFVLEDLYYFPTFVVMSSVGLIVSTLTSRLRADALLTEGRERRSLALYELSRDLAATETREALAPVVDKHMQRAFSCGGRVLAADGNGFVCLDSDSTPVDPEATAALRHAVAWKHAVQWGSSVVQPMVVAGEPVGLLRCASFDLQVFQTSSNLHFAGMPGCTAHITADAIDFAIGQSGIATVSVSIPSRQSLVGLHFFHQALVLDPAAGNVAGAVVSAAAEAVIGHW